MLQKMYDDRLNGFVNVCDPPHQVVWAHSVCAEYWPAKVMKKMEDSLRVRYFGDHTNEIVPMKNCYHYSKEQPPPPKKPDEQEPESESEQKQELESDETQKLTESYEHTLKVIIFYIAFIQIQITHFYFTTFCQTDVSVLIKAIAVHLIQSNLIFFFRKQICMLNVCVKRLKSMIRHHLQKNTCFQMYDSGTPFDPKDIRKRI